jgi:uncharacterized membrane protein
MFATGRQEPLASGSPPSPGYRREYRQKREISIYHIVYLLALTFVIVAASTLIATPVNEALGFEIPVESWYTTLALLAALTPANRSGGGEEIGNVLLHHFFAVLGAGAVLSTLVGKGAR